MENNKSYYAIIPSFVRYDKDLSSTAKLFYGEITCLCNDKGFCWASNSYFCNLYGISERTVQNILRQLSDKKYIFIELENNTKRKIFITPANNFGGGVQNFSYSPENFFAHNIKNNNINEIINEEDTFDWLND